MLHIWMGRANTGKSARVLEQIRERVEAELGDDIVVRIQF